MKDVKKDSPKGSDWTRLLTDPDLVSNLGKLLQTYREVAPDQREQALIKAMREIKEAAINARAAAATAGGTPVAAVTRPAPMPQPQPIQDAPPFAPEIGRASCR